MIGFNLEIKFTFSFCPLGTSFLLALGTSFVKYGFLLQIWNHNSHQHVNFLVIAQNSLADSNSSSTTLKTRHCNSVNNYGYQQSCKAHNCYPESKLLCQPFFEGQTKPGSLIHQQHSKFRACDKQGYKHHRW